MNASAAICDETGDAETTVQHAAAGTNGELGVLGGVDGVDEEVGEDLADFTLKAVETKARLNVGAAGEALELELETSLRERFSGDIIEAVPSGEFGGDIIHRVRNEVGRVCGTMLWEAKSTKAWNSKWPEKLRKDQRSTNAEIGLIVSNVLPAGLETFDRIDNVWVTKQRFAIPLAIALRQSLIEVSNSRRAEEGQRSKMEMVYQYLTGRQFRQRIDVIVEKFTEMQSDLSRERKAMVRIWAKREEQLKSVLDSSAGLYGDLQGIAGRALPEIEGLDFLAIGDLSPKCV